MVSVFWVVEHLSIAVGALGGILAARGKGIDWFGVATLGLVTGLGGGTLREAMLGVGPAPWVSNTSYLWTAVVPSVVAFGLLGRVRAPRRTFLLADALALALFTISGVARGLECGAPPAAAVVLGTVTGVAGGVVRDVLLGEIPLVFRRQTNFYATAALCGSIFYVALRQAMPNSFLTGSSVALIVLLRLVSIRWNLALPDFQQKS